MVSRLSWVIENHPVTEKKQSENLTIQQHLQPNDIERRDNNDFLNGVELRDQFKLATKEILKNALQADTIISDQVLLESQRRHMDTTNPN